MKVPEALTRSSLARHRSLYLMLLPGVVLFVLFQYLPMFGLVLAFKDFDFRAGVFGSPWAGLSNFEFLFATRDTITIVRNTLGYNLVFIVLGTLLSLFLAAGVYEAKPEKLGRFFQGIYLFPHFLSWVVISYLVEAFLDVEQGFINSNILAPLGVDPVFWYSNPAPWPFILPLLYLFKFAGYNSIIFYAAMVGIHKDLFDSAIIDGANKWQQTMRITFPIIAPVIVIVVLLQVGRIFNADFGLFYAVPKDSGALYSVTQVVETYVYRALTELGNIGMAAAAGFAQSVIGLVMVVTANWAVRRIDPDQAMI